MARAKQSARKGKDKEKKTKSSRASSKKKDFKDTNKKGLVASSKTSKRGKDREPEAEQPQETDNGVHQPKPEQRLTQLLGGMSMETFLREHFEQKPLLVRAKASADSPPQELFPSGLFSKEALLELTAREVFHLKRDLNVCKYVDGQRKNVCACSKSMETVVHDEDEDRDEEQELQQEDDGASTRMHRDQLDKFLQQGYSCQFFQPQRHVDELYLLNAAFEAFFGSLAGASAYLTPASSQALAPHHDDVEVFILQTQGRKHWKLYEPLIELPGEHSKDLSHDQIGKPFMEFTLEEGDVLYFPRGTVHEAIAAKDSFSTHVTISIYHRSSWAHFMELALPKVLRRAFDEQVVFRHGMPCNYLNFMGMQFANGNKEDIKGAQECFLKAFQSLVQTLQTYVKIEDLNQAADEAAMDFVAHRLPPLEQAMKQAEQHQDDEDADADADEKMDVTRSPLDHGVVFRWKDRSMVRMVMEDMGGEPMVVVYHSMKNCRRHHMKRCTCAMKEMEDDDEEDNEDEEKDNHTNGDSGSDDDNDEEEQEMEEEEQMEAPLPPRSVCFPMEIAPALLRLFSAYPSTVRLKELKKLCDDETAVRGMLLRLWSEDLLEVSPRCK